MPRSRAERELGKMLQVMLHEPFYVSGAHLDESAGVYVGWVLRQQPFEHDLPLRNPAGDIAIFFSGEEFSSPSVCSAGQRGAEDAGGSDLVNDYDQDSAFPSRLNGRFHGLVVDKRRKKILLFNDRYGLQRLYYHAGPNGFYFAAEAKAILAVCPELRGIDARSLGELITCGCVLENRSLFEGIQVLPPASAWTFEGDTPPRQSRYFESSEWETQEPLSSEDYYQELKATFARILPTYFRSSNRIGMSLTGGLDTRMIMAWHRAKPAQLPCYSFGGMYRDCQDVVIARRVAQACGQSHHVIPVGREFLSNFLRYAERSIYLTDGCVDVSHSPDLYANERAAKIASVRMTGNYGGEVLRRVRAFKPTAMMPELFVEELLPNFASAKQTYSSAVQMHPLSFSLFRQAPWHHYGLSALEQTQLSVRSPFLDNQLIQTIYRAPRSSYESNDISMRLIADGDKRVAQIRTDRGHLAGRSNVSLRAMHQWIELTAKAEYAYDYGMPQLLAGMDHMLSCLHLERLFLGRHKFYHFRLWYRDLLSSSLRDVLLDRRSLARPYLHEQVVRKIVHAHTTGKRNYTLEIHKLLTLEFIHRLLVDNPPSTPTFNNTMLAELRQG